MRKKYYAVPFALLPLLAQSQIKVDLDISGRNTTEVTEPGYTAWVANTNNTLTEGGATFTMTSLASTGSLSSTWYKAGIQSPSYAHLVCDGVYIKDCTGKDAGLQLTIKGLSAGEHTILTYHNAVDDYTGKSISPIDIYVNGNKAVSKLSPTQRALSTDDCKTAYITFTATNGGTTTIQFKANTDKAYDAYQVYLNGFAIDVPNSAMQATLLSPEDGDLHTDCDATNSATLSWKAANGAKSHNVYCGTDKNAVETATTTSSEYLGNQTATTKTITDLYSMNTYYWRIDEVDADGNVTKGNVWSFRPRVLAFDGAEGYGKYSIGGRGGKVVYVTNLNDDGEGSFREAMTNDIGPRTIVFSVSGVIKLASRLTQAGKNVTIAAQTAPGRGVCISAAPVGIGAESQCRFLRCRLGSGQTFDGLGMAGADNSITDHCSVSWTIDEAFSSRNAKNMTLQRTLISEALNIAGHKNYPEGTGHGYAATIGGDIASFHHNLLAHNQGRNWSMGGGLDGNGYYAGRLDIFNNVVYNWWHRVTDGGAHEVNFVGNYYKRGAASEESNMDYMLNAELEGVGKGSQSYYFHNNIMAHKDGSLIYNGTDDTKGRRQTVASTQTVDWEVFRSQPFFPSFATVDNARNAYKSVLSDVGATMPVLDSHDLRMINETLGGSYSCIGAKSKVGGIIDASGESKEGDYSYYLAETRPADFDTDMDGLPDWYEKLVGTDPNSLKGDFSDSNADPDRDGYTNLEEYLKWMATPRAETKLGETASFTLKEYFRAYTSSPSYTVSENKDKLDIAISNGVASVSSTIPGIHYFRITVKDGEGDTFTRLFAIYAEGEIKPKTLIYQSDTTANWEIADNWTPNIVPTDKDTAIVRKGEVNINNDILSYVIIEKEGTYRIRKSVEAMEIHLQGGTIKSYTSNPQFVLSVGDLYIDDASVFNCGSTPSSEFVLSGRMHGSADLTKTKTGLLTLKTDATDYTGHWTLTDGSMDIQAENAVGSGGIAVKDTAKLIVSAPCTTATLETDATASLILNADIKVTTAFADGKQIVKGTYTSADLPELIKGDGRLIVLEGENAGAESILSDDISIYPNPADDYIIIRTNGTATTSIFNQDGIIMFKGKVCDGERIDVSQLGEGVYMVVVETEKGSSVQKVVIK